tara:strand:+ start:31 stop:726 length:696 start_codon:yes stop_codon:yes gene_type:complete
MESLSETNIENKNSGFLNYVFNFDDKNKEMLLNMFQYAFVSLPLIIIVLKVINHFSPEENDEKGNLEIIFEVLISLVSILLAIWFINKIVNYIPTYSKIAYSEFNEISFMLPFLILLFTMQTKIGKKINILLERLIDLYEGRVNLKENQKNKDIKTSQPISQPPVHQNSQADQLINSQSFNTNQQFNNQISNQQPEINFNNMYAGPNNQLIDAQEPMAANESLGGMFGTLF